MLEQQTHPEQPITDAMSSLTIQDGAELITSPTATSNTATEIMMSRTLIVDPSLYRILQEYTPMNESHGDNTDQVIVPNSRIEILRQQVFQKLPSPPPPAPHTSMQPPEPPMSKQTITTSDNDEKSSDDDDDSETNYEPRTARRHHHQPLPFDTDDDDDDTDDDVADPKKNHGNAEKHEVEEDKADVEEDSDDQLPEQLRGRTKKNNDKKKKKKHLQLVQSQMAENADDEVVRTEPTPASTKAGKKLPKRRDNNERKGPVDEITTSSTTVESFGTGNHNDNNSNNNNGTSTGSADKPLYTCNTCIGVENSFSTTAEYRAHFRSDWHRYNQKLKSCHATPISYREFMTCDAESFFNNTTSNDDF